MNRRSATIELQMRGRIGSGKASQIIWLQGGEEVPALIHQANGGKRELQVEPLCFFLESTFIGECYWA